MNKLLAMLLCLAAGLASARAGNFTNAGIVYYDVSLLTNRCNAGGIVFSHRSGISRLDFMELTEAERATYGFDQARYEAFKAEEALRRPTPAPMPPPPVAESPAAASPPEVRVVTRVVVISNTAPPLQPFTSPVSTIEPNYQKLNETRLKAVLKGMELNAAARGNKSGKNN